MSNSSPFILEVQVQRRPHMRDPNLEAFMYMGTGVLAQIFDEMRVDNSITHVQFYYPERWLNIVEGRCLFQRLIKYCPNLKKVQIITQSVDIISQCPPGSMKIVSSADEITHLDAGEQLKCESLDGTLWYENELSFIEASGKALTLYAE